ncbi:MAG: hypothetical protein AAFQ09_06165 [Pseudomonadota bacterium]
MRITKTLATSAALIALGTAGMAGGLADEIMEAPVVAVDEAPAPAGTSISPTFVILGVLAALLIAAAVADDDDDDDDTEEEENGQEVILTAAD